MDTLLIPEVELQRAVNLIRGLTAKQDGKWSARSDDDPLYRAFGYYLLFCDWHAMEDAGLGPRSEVEAFYNRYFWFLVFSGLRQAMDGYDAGLEQQAFRMLEQAPANIDWSVVEKVAARASVAVGSRLRGRGPDNGSPRSGTKSPP